MALFSTSLESFIVKIALTEGLNIRSTRQITLNIKPPAALLMRTLQLEQDILVNCTNVAHKRNWQSCARIVSYFVQPESLAFDGFEMWEGFAPYLIGGLDKLSVQLKYWDTNANLWREEPDRVVINAGTHKAWELPYPTVRFQQRYLPDGSDPHDYFFFKNFLCEDQFGTLQGPPPKRDLAGAFISQRHVVEQSYVETINIPIHYSRGFNHYTSFKVQNSNFFGSGGTMKIRKANLSYVGKELDDLNSPFRERDE